MNIKERKKYLHNIIGVANSLGIEINREYPTKFIEQEKDDDMKLVVADFFIEMVKSFLTLEINKIIVQKKEITADRKEAIKTEEYFFRSLITTDVFNEAFSCEDKYKDINEALDYVKYNVSVFNDFLKN